MLERMKNIYFIMLQHSSSFNEHGFKVVGETIYISIEFDKRAIFILEKSERNKIINYRIPDYLKEEEVKEIIEELENFCKKIKQKSEEAEKQKNEEWKKELFYVLDKD